MVFFADAGITTEQVMTDNGPAYRFHAFAATVGTIKHRFADVREGRAVQPGPGIGMGLRPLL